VYLQIFSIMKFLWLFVFGFSISVCSTTQSVPNVTIKNPAHLKLISNYIAECKLKTIINDTLGLVFVTYNRIGDGYTIHLSAIKEEGKSHFTRLRVPTQYTFVDGVLVLFGSQVIYQTQFSPSYLQSVDTLVEGHFKRLEEEGGMLVKWKNINGKLVKIKYISMGGVHNGTLVSFKFDDKIQRITKDI